eukprot:SAG31_NODE_3575_length_4110_cov_2.432560_1_plen_99_part_10
MRIRPHEYVHHTKFNTYIHVTFKFRRTITYVYSRITIKSGDRIAVRVPLAPLPDRAAGNPRAAQRAALAGLRNLAPLLRKGPPAPTNAGRAAGPEPFLR